MENKKLYIGLGIATVVGIAYYMWNKNKVSDKSIGIDESKSGVDGDCGCVCKSVDKSNYKSSFYGNAPIYQGREVESFATPYIPYNNSNKRPLFYAY